MIYNFKSKVKPLMAHYYTVTLLIELEFEFVLFNDISPDLRKDIQWYMYTCMTILFSSLANHQSRLIATSKMGCQPGDCR